MTINISIPSPLRSYTDNQKKVEVNATNVATALQNLVIKFPNLKNHLFDGEDLRNFVNVYLNNEDIRYLDQKQDTPLVDGDDLAIIPSIAGGI